MLRDNWLPLEGDFQRCYGKDLRLEVEHEGVRRLWALVQGLPADAVIWADIQKEEAPAVEPEPERKVVKDPGEIQAMLAKAGLIERG